MLYNLNIKKYKKANLKKWREISNMQKNPKYSVNIGIIGKYIELKDAYKSLSEALYHSGIHNSTEIKIIWINAEKSVNIKNALKSLNGI